MKEHESPEYIITMEEFRALLEPLEAAAEEEPQLHQDSKVVSGLQATLFSMC